MPPVPVRFHLTADLFQSEQAGSPVVLKTTRHLRTEFRAEGDDVSLDDDAGGHDVVVRRGTLVDGLMRHMRSWNTVGRTTGALRLNRADRVASSTSLP